MNTSLEELPNVVSMKINYVGEVTSEYWVTEEPIPSKLDQWEVIISGPSGHHVLDYFTELTARHKEHFWSKAKVVKPSFVTILSEFAKCSNAVNYTFYHYCKTNGYSNDSIKALIVYKSYLDIAHAMHTHFSEEDLCRICDLLHS